MCARVCVKSLTKTNAFPLLLCIQSLMMIVQYGTTGTLGEIKDVKGTKV